MAPTQTSLQIFNYRFVGFTTEPHTPISHVLGSLLSCNVKPGNILMRSVKTANSHNFLAIRLWKVLP